MSSTTDPGRERGQILVLFAGAVVVLLIVAALAFDVGMILVERRDQQNAADAAALAGARYVLTDPVAAEDAARRLGRENGFDDADASEVVNVYIPAIHGRFAGFPGFIEVQIESTRPSIFGGIIGRATWPIGAFAVATDAQNPTFPFGMLALNPTECKAIAVSGGGVVESYANIQSNSNGAECTTPPPAGISRTGGATIDVIAPDATCRTVGTFQDQGSGPPITCAKVENSFALPDPLRNLAAPSMPGLAAAMVPVGHTQASPARCPGATGGNAPTLIQAQPCDVGGNGSAYRDLSWILYPGLYPGGLAVTNGATAYLMPGIYWIGGGGMDIGGGNASVVTIAVTTDATATPATNVCATATTTATLCGGVMFYNSKTATSPGGPVILNASGARMKIASLNLPSGDPDAMYNDIVFFQDRTVPSPMTLNGSSSATLVEGIVYAPAAQIKLLGNGGTLILDQVIADTYDIRGDGGTIRVMREKGIDAVITAAGLVD